MEVSRTGLGCLIVLVLSACPSGGDPAASGAHAGSDAGRDDAGVPAAPDATPHKTVDPAACMPGPAGADLVYSWTYQTIISNDANGNPLTTSVSGNLTLRNDGSYEQDLYIGDVLNYSTGTYDVCGDKLVFHTDDGENLDYAFTVGMQDGRTVFVYQSPDPMIYGLELDPCGDNVCSAGETVTACPNDCGSCGDKLCASTETAPECADCVH